VRIVAATHQNLERLVEQGTFREDLFHRLNVIRVHVPSLSERREDIPLLAKHFLDAAAIELGDEPKILDSAAAEYLSLLPWPGNVRQLENTCRWLQVMASSRTILIEDLPPELQQSETSADHRQLGNRPRTLGEPTAGKVARYGAAGYRHAQIRTGDD
jgi:two-component system nitrogen regulation response regulator GlnG